MNLLKKRSILDLNQYEGSLEILTVTVLSPTGAKCVDSDNLMKEIGQQLKMQDFYGYFISFQLAFHQVRHDEIIGKEIGIRDGSVIIDERRPLRSKCT
ncbi:hypothetical protein FQR65_LT02977 [Abscondita terminalis]|nr:hypothetical protein FQR65_LT02977 [Abscondita terminalis]